MATQPKSKPDVAPTTSTNGKKPVVEVTTTTETSGTKIKNSAEAWPVATTSATAATNATGAATNERHNPNTGGQQQQHQSKGNSFKRHKAKPPAEYNPRSWQNRWRNSGYVPKNRDNNVRPTFSYQERPPFGRQNFNNNYNNNNNYNDNGNNWSFYNNKNNNSWNLQRQLPPDWCNPFSNSQGYPKSSDRCELRWERSSHPIPAKQQQKQPQQEPKIPSLLVSSKETTTKDQLNNKEQTNQNKLKNKKSDPTEKPRSTSTLARKNSCDESISWINAKELEKNNNSENSNSLAAYRQLEELKKAPTQQREETNTTQPKELTVPRTNPKIQVKPLSQLLRQEIIALTREKKEETATSPAEHGAIKSQLKATPRIRERTSSSSSVELTINERLATMGKEALKYIINNKDTIYDEHLQLQARRRLREEIRRQLKEIELEKPKDETKELVEDEIVDAIKLPQVLLQNIEKFFGIDISVAEVECDQSEKKTEEPKDKGQSQANQTDSLETMAKQSKISTDLMRRLKVAEEFKASASKRSHESATRTSRSKSPHAPVDSKRRKKSVEELKERSPKKAERSPKKSEPSSKQVQSKPAQTAPNKVASPAPIKEPVNAISATNGREQTDNKDVAPIKVEIKPELPGESQFSENIIVLSSSEDEDEEEVPKKQAAKPDNDASKKQNFTINGENVISSFEKLVLPYLGKELTERYRTKHCLSNQTRLHFISCVCTSEYNSETFSKIEIANIQRNLKSSQNQVGLEFLLREIVNVVNYQKQVAQKKQETEETNKISDESLTNAVDKNAETAPDLPSKTPAHQTNATSPEIAETANAETELCAQPSTISGTPPAISPPRNLTPTAGPVNGLLPATATFAASALPTRLPVLPYLSMESTLPRLSPGSLPLHGNCSLDNSESLFHLGLSESVTHSLLETDRRLLENQNRRSFLEEMIMKFQKEKSDLEMQSLELQNRKFLLLNTAISRNQPINGPMPSSSPPTIITAPVPTISPTENVVHITKAKPRLKRRTVFLKRVKVLPKRKATKNRLILPKATPQNQQADELQREIEKSLQACEESKKSTASNNMPLPMRLSVSNTVIKDEPIDVPTSPPTSHPKPADDYDVAKAKSFRSMKPKSTSTTAQQQPLAVIPPLPPPPPPPEPIANMSYDLPRSIPKTSPAKASNTAVQSPPIANLNYDFIPSGRLHNIKSPITQLCIYKVYIIAAAEDGDVYMFNIGSHKLERQITKHSEAITNMFLCEKESFLYTTSLDGFLKKSSLENLERVLQTVYFKEPLQSIDVEWGIAFIGSRWGNIFTYNLTTNKVIDMPLLGTGQSIIAVKATKEGVRKILVLGCKGNSVYMHDAATGLLLRRLSVPEGLNVYSLLLNEVYVYCGTQKNEIFKFDFASGALVSTLNCGNGAVSMATYKDRYLLVGCYDGYIYVLDKIKNVQVGRFEGSGRLVLALAITGDKVVTSSKDTSLEILEIPPELLNLGQCSDSV
ncbi:histone-lysine N-methyltransferase, H3 lysine-79 specific [Scaptodrosophila lebanonensis]|uniref:Histone-lysine N-methyltransferase, H3 lysine-79 specific n=1 Tax=Drosophila lebanonensis TaxID=7225 RepID=A0A6J2TF82_DROLE|nr:histone-lysine N-methyltransferase, H3 lysine-79 specific [Scaptodrosophila lebanonensis]